MTSSELATLIRDARKLDQSVPIDPTEEWDSLDHMAIIGAIMDLYPESLEASDMSNSTNFASLSLSLNVQ